MKKVLYTSSLFLVVSFVAFTSCKKVNEGPFPAKPQTSNNYSDFPYVTPLFPGISNASGVLIAAQVYDRKVVTVSSFQNYYEYGMAQFTNTPGNFTSLVDMGAITINDSNLVKSNSYSYLSNTGSYGLNFSNNVVWKLQGNSTLPAFHYTLNGVFPAFSDSFQYWDDTWLPSLPIKNVQNNDSLPYDTATLFQIPISAKVTNADSVFIAFSSNGVVASKMVAANAAQATFRRTDFRIFTTTGYDPTLPLILQINPIKYSDTTINTKNYYFLKMGSYIKYYQATR